MTRMANLDISDKHDGPAEKRADRPDAVRDERLRVGAELRIVMMIAQRELIRFFRAKGRVVTSLIQPLVFLFLLGYGLTPLIGDEGDVSFMQFMLAGVVAMSIVTTAVFSGFSIVWDREFGFLREMLVAPVSRVALVTGKVAGGMLVATTQGIVLLLLAPLVGISLAPLLLLGAIGITALAATALTALGVLIASHIQKMESYHVLMQLLMLPMIFLSGAMFPLNSLPAWLSAVTYLNPLTYAVDPLRQTVLANVELSGQAQERFGPGLEVLGYSLPTAVALLVVAGFTLVFTAGAIRGFSKTD